MYKDTAIVFSFDKLNQLDLTELVINSLDLTNNIDIVFLVSPNIIDDINLNKLVDKYLVKLIAFPSNEMHGKFYWYNIPFLTNYDYYLCVDNDLIFKDVDINSFIKRYSKKLSKKPILGVKAHVWRVKTKREIIRAHRSNTLSYFINIFKYINTGVVLINGHKYRKLFDWQLINGWINNFVQYSRKNKITPMDQEFMSIYFYKYLSYISPRYNLRIKYPYYMNKFSAKRGVIFHFNLWRWINGRKLKFDLITNIKNNDINEFKLKLKNFWSSDMDYRISKKFEKSLDNFVLSTFKAIRLQSKKKFSIFIPFYNELDDFQLEYLENLTNTIKEKRSRDINLVISDNSINGLPFVDKLYADYKMRYIDTLKNKSLFLSMDALEKGDVLLILDPDDKINLKNLIDNYGNFNTDVIQINWSDSSFRNKTVKRLSNYATLNRMENLRNFMSSDKIWDQKAADDYALNISILNNGGTYSILKTKVIYKYEKYNPKSVTNFDSKKFNYQYLIETKRLFDYHCESNLNDFKPFYLYNVKLKKNFQNNREFLDYFNKGRNFKYWLIIRSYFYWRKLK